jgi:hypothetical protein
MRKLATIFALALLGCGSTEPGDEFSGSYALQTVNGQPLPFVTTASTVTARLNSGLLTISPKGEWSLIKSGTIQTGTQAPQTAVETIIGTWHLDGSSVKLLASSPPTVLTATVANGSAAYTDEGRTYVFQR